MTTPCKEPVMVRLTIFVKFLLAALGIALIPLLVSSAMLFSELRQVGDQLAIQIGKTAESDAAEALEMRARHVADSVSDFLKTCESDLIFLQEYSQSPDTIISLYHARQRTIWRRAIDAAGVAHETKRSIPIYRTIAVIDKNGVEQFAIHKGSVVPKTSLRIVTSPQATEFKSESYFSQIKKLKPNEIYLSRVTGFHINKQQQLHGATEPENARGHEYEGVVRMGIPLYRGGLFQGALILSIDHQHLMEFTQHIAPGSANDIVFPSYKSGNYAFMFDDQGWIITHPKYWDIRGVDSMGNLVPPYSSTTPKSDVDSGKIPFNLDYAGFIHPNYPLVASMVRKGESGVVELTNVGGARKIMAYAPIRYTRGVYRDHGIFGGITIGYQVNQFQQQSRIGSDLITTSLADYRTKSAYIVIASAGLAAVAAWLLARGISRPLLRLNQVARLHARGDTAARVPVAGNDELSELAQSFNHMIDELDQRNTRLVSTLDELKSSRLEILNERNFKENILESISSAITTFDVEGRLTSLNSTAVTFFGRSWPLTTQYHDVFAEFGSLPQRIETAYTMKTGYGREPLTVFLQGIERHFDAGIFPIGDNASLGVTVTLRDETIREQLRAETVRLERLASLGKLAAGISHEIRNPLTGISLLLDDLHDRAPLDESDRKMLSKALAEIERIERMVTSLLTFAAPPRSSFTTVNIVEPVRDVCLLMERPCERQGTKLVVSSDDSELLCNIDVDKIRQAVLNLIKNALEVLTEGGQITVHTSRKGTDALIEVTDNGKGISNEDLPLIFEPFFTRKGAGTGLGLSITRQIIEEHHGTISVSSKSSHGTRFTINMPLVS